MIWCAPLLTVSTQMNAAGGMIALTKIVPFALCMTFPSGTISSNFTGSI